MTTVKTGLGEFFGVVRHAVKDEAHGHESGVNASLKKRLAGV